MPPLVVDSECYLVFQTYKHQFCICKICSISKKPLLLATLKLMHNVINIIQPHFDNTNTVYNLTYELNNTRLHWRFQTRVAETYK